jgi:hypothetical protein
VYAAQIAVDGADHGYRDLRIENTLTNEHGDDVKLKKGAHVEVTVICRTKDVIVARTVFSVGCRIVSSVGCATHDTVVRE